MDISTSKILLAASGGAAGGDPVYVDDVFSTYLWDGTYGGTNSAVTINNGIDLSGEGGLVWTKHRNYGNNHQLYDTERGAGQPLYSSISNGEGSNPTFSSFNSNGFSLAAGSANLDALNGGTSQKYTAWTFRKAPGFFDVVTYTGTGSARTVAHNLGSVPGMIIVKNRTIGSNWIVYHRSTGATKKLELNENSLASTNSGSWNDTEPTASVFTVGANNSGTDGSGNGYNYVAYVFAHDDASFGTDLDESIIKCGSYPGNGNVQEINLGFEPQWVMIKRTEGLGAWFIYDTMRGIFTGGNDLELRADANQAETAYSNAVEVTATGFKLMSGASSHNSSGEDYIYMAIRRPHKPPEVATDVFAIDRGNGSTTIPAFDSGFPVDFAFRLSAYASSGNNPRTHTRLQGAKELYVPLTAVEADDAATVFDSMSGMSTGFTTNDLAWMFKRAPGFMDVVAWDGDGASVKNVSHNLEKVPEMVISKMRGPTTGSSSYGGDRWYVYHKDAGGTLGLNESGSTVTSDIIFNPAPTATNLPFDNPSYDSTAVNGSGKRYIASLFATLPGISNVGSYSGTGNAINVDCGFAYGARFVLIKRTDGSGDWYLYDTYRGIWSGADPYILLNTTNGSTGGTNYIHPLNAGFTITAAAPAALNASGGNYIFLAIA